MPNEVQIANIPVPVLIENTPLEVRAPFDIPVEVKNEVTVHVSNTDSFPVPAKLERTSAPTALITGRDYDLIGEMFFGPAAVVTNPVTIRSLDFFPWVLVQTANQPATQAWLNMNLVPGFRPH